MNNKILKNLRGGGKNSLTAFALLLFFSATQTLHAAADASVNVYLTRGYDGTGSHAASTATGVFATDGGEDFSDRIVSAANRIDQIPTGVVNPTTGARLDGSTDPTYNPDGSIYLHIGHFNSGYVGAGSTVENFMLNGDLVIGRLGIENVYWESGAYNDGKGPAYTTPNVAQVFTAGASDYTLTFNYTKEEANEMLFFRSSSDNQYRVDPVVHTFTLDCNIEFAGIYAKSGSVFQISNGNHLILGSNSTSNPKRTITVGKNLGATATNLIMTNGPTTPSTITVYSDLMIEGTVGYVYRGVGHFNVHGDTTIRNTGFENYFSLITLSGNGTATSDPGKAIVNGAVKVEGATSNSMDVFFLNRAGNYLELNGAVTFNALAGATTTLITLNASDTEALATGAITVNSDAGTSAHLFRVNANNQKITSKGKIILENAGNLAIARFQSGSVGQSIIIDSDIEIKKIKSEATRLVFFANAGTDSTTLAGTSVAIFNGDITITDNTFTQVLLGTRADYTVTEFYGKLSAPTRTQQTSFASGGTRALVNFRGKVDNDLNNIGFRGSVYNLLNTNDSAAVKATASISFGGGAHLNIFGEKQLQISSTATWQLWGAGAGSVSGTVNLNGLKSLKIGKYDPYGTNRHLIIDFGMSDHGMTANQLIANNITADMINETAKGIAQTITLGGIKDTTAPTVGACYILFKNYVVGEDKIICEVQLSKTSLNGELCYSADDISKNILRIDGYTDADKYGSEYYLQETALGNGTWEYSMYIIPEPATVAAILGLAALAFAAYRRRK